MVFDMQHTQVIVGGSAEKGEKEYFWYYEILINDKPSSEFDIEVEN